MQLCYAVYLHNNLSYKVGPKLCINRDFSRPWRIEGIYYGIGSPASLNWDDSNFDDRYPGSLYRVACWGVLGMDKVLQCLQPLRTLWTDLYKANHFFGKKSGVRYQKAGVPNKQGIRTGGKISNERRRENGWANDNWGEGIE